LTPNDHYRGRIAPLTSKRCILYTYSTNIGTEYFKHGIKSPFFYIQNAVCFIILTYLIPVLFTFCIQNVLKLKKNNPGAKRLTEVPNTHGLFCCLPFHIYGPVTTLLVSNTLPKIPLFFPKPKVFVSVVQKARSRRQSKNIFTLIPPPPHTMDLSPPLPSSTYCYIYQEVIYIHVLVSVLGDTSLFITP
jgi:hypothetical protein